MRAEEISHSQLNLDVANKIPTLKILTFLGLTVLVVCIVYFFVLNEKDSISLFNPQTKVTERNFKIEECNTCDLKSKCVISNAYTDLKITSNVGSLKANGIFMYFPDVTNSDGFGYENCNIEADKGFAFQCSKSAHTNSMHYDYTKNFDGKSTLTLHELVSFKSVNNGKPSSSHLVCKLFEIK